MHLRSHDPYRPNSASAAPRLPRRTFSRRRDSDDDVEAEGSDSAGSIDDGGSRFNIIDQRDHGATQPQPARVAAPPDARDAPLGRTPARFEAVTGCLFFWVTGCSFLVLRTPLHTEGSTRTARLRQIQASPPLVVVATAAMA